MALNQMNEKLNDAFETYFPRFDPIRRFFYLGFSLLTLLTFRIRIWLFGGRILVNERIVEYPQVLRWIRTEGLILDIGCVSSRLPIQLASLGYTVHGLDVRPYFYKHPNFTFFKDDIFNWVPEKSYNIIIMLSVLEHLGLGGYGDIKVADADKQAVDKIASWLSTKGQLIVTVPFGKTAVTKKHRIYDQERLRYVFSGFKWIESRFFRRLKNNWIPSTSEELENVPSLLLPPNGVALLNLEKKESTTT